MLSHRIEGIVIFVLFVIVSCIGCYRDEIYYRGSTAIGIVSISEDRPAEVLMSVAGVTEGCGPTPFRNVYADRVENTIFLKATVLESHNGGYTCSAIDELYGEVTVKDLEVGEYKIVANDREHLRLRIEKETAYVLLKPIIKDITVQMKTSEGIERFDSFQDPWIETAEPVQVTIGVEGYFDYGIRCEFEEMTDIAREAEDINVDISSEVLIADCIADVSILNGGALYDAEIDLGLFGQGDYRVNVNGHEVRFSIRLPGGDDKR